MRSDDEFRFSASVLTKARRLVRQGLVRPDGEHDSIWWVKSSTSDTKDEYRVQTDRERWITCTCAHGLNTGGGQAYCSHAAAVLMTIEQSMKEQQA